MDTDQEKEITGDRRKMAKRKYEDCFLRPEITQAGEYQVFTMKGKDARGYNWQVRLAPVTAKTYPAGIPKTIDADRVELYVGSKPAEIGKISGEMEVKLGKEGEKYTVDKAMLVYIPKGMPVEHKIVKKPEDITWLLNINLTPKYVAPKGGK
jgi:hypothetical protein